MASRKKATFGGGCFWCLEAFFQTLDGVNEVVSGYAGGQTLNPTYREVCSGSTGHAEVVSITYDPEITGFQDLLDLFWRCHDPTTLNRQGADMGTQYRSIILYHDEKQKELAQRSRKELDESSVFENPVVTEIAPLERFYPAEKEHHNYYRNNPNAGYCRVVIKPKLDKLMGR